MNNALGRLIHSWDQNIEDLLHSAFSTIELEKLLTNQETLAKQLAIVSLKS